MLHDNIFYCIELKACIKNKEKKMNVFKLIFFSLTNVIIVIYKNYS